MRKYELTKGTCETCAFGKEANGVILCQIGDQRECIPGMTAYKLIDGPSQAPRIKIIVPQTNGDRIRAMNNEELAELLYEASDTVGCPGRPGHWHEWECPIEGTKKPCDGLKCWLDWLNAEAKEEE